MPWSCDLPRVPWSPCCSWCMAFIVFPGWKGRFADVALAGYNERDDHTSEQFVAKRTG